jgi:hypothetical protein
MIGIALSWIAKVTASTTIVFISIAENGCGALGVLNPLASSALLTGGLVSITAGSLLGGFSWLRWFVASAVPAARDGLAAD